MKIPKFGVSCFFSRNPPKRVRNLRGQHFRNLSKYLPVLPEYPPIFKEIFYPQQILRLSSSSIPIILYKHPCCPRRASLLSSSSIPVVLVEQLPDFITFLSPSNGTIGNQPFNFTKRVAQGGASRKLPTFASCMYEKRRTVPAQ